MPMTCESCGQYFNDSNIAVGNPNAMMAELCREFHKGPIKVIQVIPLRCSLLKCEFILYLSQLPSAVLVKKLLLKEGMILDINSTVLIQNNKILSNNQLVNMTSDTDPIYVVTVEPHQIPGSDNMWKKLGIIDSMNDCHHFCNSVYILLKNRIAIGTCFIISTKRLCTTASHFNIDDNPVIEDCYEITLEILRDNNQIQFCEVVYKVHLVHIDTINDFAIIELPNGSQFESSDVIRICEQKDIPLSGNEPEFKIYACRISDFNAGLMDIVSSYPMTNVKSRISAPGFRHLHYANGLHKEYSGSLIMNCSNWTAIAMHLDNLSSFQLKRINEWPDGDITILDTLSSNLSYDGVGLVLSYVNIQQFIS